MNLDFLGECQYIPTEEIKSPRAKYMHILNLGLKAYRNKNNIVVGDHRFKPGTNWSETNNQDTTQ